MKITVIEEVWREPGACEACGIRALVLFADLQEDCKLIHQPIVDLKLLPFIAPTLSTPFTVE